MKLRVFCAHGARSVNLMLLAQSLNNLAILYDNQSQHTTARTSSPGEGAPILPAKPVSQKTFRIGNVGADLCEKFYGLHFGVFRAGE